MTSFFLPQGVSRLLSVLEKPRLILPTQLATMPKTQQVLIGTHDGSFHCDEALAIGLLHLNPKFSAQELSVVRTRNPDILQQCDLVVDVGAVYNPSTHRYDHHQREFTGTLEPFNMKLSSAGLIYKHFGKDILHSVIQSYLAQDITLDHELVDLCYKKTYKDFMEHIDAIDNGVSIADTPNKYHISTSLSARVGYLNLPWNAESSDPTLINEQFSKAMYLTTSEFLHCVYNIATVFYPARSIVSKAMAQRGDASVFDSRIIVLEHYCPWTEHLYELEETDASREKVLYTLYEDSSKSWRIQAVPVSAHSFDSRKALPKAWRGVRDDALSQLTGVEGCIFVHASGFIGGAKTKEGAIALATKALEMEE